MDAFNRTRPSGWGTADVGGAWTVGGTATRYPVSPGTASMIVPAGQTLSAALASVSSSDSDIKMTLSSDKLATGNGVYVTVVGRRVGTNLEYQARVRLRADGTVAIGLGALTGTSTAVTLRPDVDPERGVRRRRWPHLRPGSGHRDVADDRPDEGLERRRRPSRRPGRSPPPTRRPRCRPRARSR